MNRRLSLCRVLCAGLYLAGLLALLGLNENAQAQQGKYFTQASTRLSTLIDKANGDGFKLDTNKFSSGGGWLNQGTAWVSLFTINLEAGKKYRLLAAGDDDARDVDLRVMDPAKTEVAKDVATAKTAEVDYTPKTTLKYLVQVRVYDSLMGKKGKVPSYTLATVMVER